MTTTLPTDPLLLDIAAYAADYEVKSEATLQAARHCLLDSLACAFESLEHAECTRLLGPVVPGTTVPAGARVPGTSFVLDPVKAAFDIATMVRWLDLSDTWIAVQTTHPSDDVGAILATADWLGRNAAKQGRAPLSMRDLLAALTKAHELQGALGAHFRLSTHGIDNVLLTKIACAAVVTRMLGGTRGQIANAVSLAFFEPSLSLHRFGSNTGPRKGWAGGDATADAVRFALMAVQGEPGYPQVLSHKDWGFEKSFLGGNALRMGEPGEGVIQGVLYKFHPAVIHVQSAVECAIRLHPQVAGRLEDIASITLETHREVMAKVSKTGPLRNAADRDHCLQYSVAVALLKGGLVAHDYEDEAAADSRIDRLRELMQAGENPEFTRRYLDPASGANPNAIEVRFRDGTSSGRVEIDQPAGHPRRRAEGMPMLLEKFQRAVAGRFAPQQAGRITALCLDHERFLRTPVHEVMDVLAR